MTKDALLEIGTEEIPARFLIGIEKKIIEIISSEFKEKRIKHEKVDIFITPRRIAMLFKKIQDKTESETIEIIGPPVKIAKGRDGTFLKPAYKFAELYGVKVNELSIKSTPRGEYLAICKLKEGKKTQEILPEVFKNIISKLEFPKSMVWNDSKFNFARPIRWILALYDHHIVKFNIANVSSSNVSFGLLSLGSKKIKINSTAEYIHKLKNQYIIIDQEERKEIIKKTVKKLSQKVNAIPLLNEDLLNELTHITEYPIGIICSFDEKYLKLPKEVLLTCLKKQKFIPLVDEKNLLKNNFIGIKNGLSEDLQITKFGYEAVMNAKLRDAEFYFEIDKQTPLESKVDELKNITYHEELGSMYDKTNKLILISEFLCKMLNIDEKTTEKVKRAAYLSKSDITTQMVYEYPELHGTMGKIYALYHGEDEDVSLAIEEHRFPLPDGKSTPKTQIGKILSIADKIDTIVSIFSTSYKPSGSGDPYGLRRDAFGLMKIILENELKISMTKLIEFVNKLNKQKLNKRAFLDFLQQRLETLLTEFNYKPDEIRSVIKDELDDILTIEKKISAIHSLREEEKFKNFLTVYKRVANILKQAKEKNIYVEYNNLNPKEFICEEEKKLYRVTIETEQNYKENISKSDFKEALRNLIGMNEEINAFFDNVLIISENEKERKNRIALLDLIKNMFDQFADFSKIQT